MKKKFIGNFRSCLLTEELFDSIPELSYLVPNFPYFLTDVIIKPKEDGVEIDFPSQFAAEIEAVANKHNPLGKTKAEKEAKGRKKMRAVIAEKLKLSVVELDRLLER